MAIRPEILSRRQELADICRKYRVKTLEVFGSAATEQFDPNRSDVDLLLEFDDESLNGYFDRYFGLKEALEKLFGRPVDLVTVKSIRNRFFLAAISQNRVPLYGT